MNKVYYGRRLNPEMVASSDVVVFILEPHEQRTLDIEPSQKVWNHSTGLNWGYNGSGPAQLALAILLDFTDDAEVATSYHQEFKREVVSTWKDHWSISGDEIKAWLKLAVQREFNSLQ